jgi:hypothetical protein
LLPIRALKFAILGIKLGDHVHLGLATIASLVLMDVYKHSYVQNKAKALAVECAARHMVQTQEPEICPV